MDILQLLPRDVYEAAIGASSPSASNVFATANDLAAISSTSIYNSDDSLTGNRTVTMAGNNLTFFNSTSGVSTSEKVINTYNSFDTGATSVDIWEWKNVADAARLVIQKGVERGIVMQTAGAGTLFRLFTFGGTTGVLQLGVNGTINNYITASLSVANYIKGDTVFGAALGSTIAKVQIVAPGALSSDHGLRVRDSTNTSDILDVRGNNTIVMDTLTGSNFQNALQFNKLGGFGVSAIQSWNDGGKYGLAFGTGASLDGITTRMMVSSDGFVRIGGTVTGSIAYRLHVQGDVGIDSQLTVGSIIGVGGATPYHAGVGTSAIVLKNGTPPSAGVVDYAHIYSADVVAGNAAPHFRTENGDIIKLFKDAAWTGITGTASKAGFDTTTGTLQDVKETLKAIQDHLIALGLL